MKKVLFATTALIATAGMAAAGGVNLSGGSRFGIVYTQGAADTTVVHNRFTLNVDASVDTDAGATFFSRVRVRGGENAGTGGSTASTTIGTASGSGISAPRVGVSIGSFTLATGNIYGALESTPNLYSGDVGLTGLGWGNLPITNTILTTAANGGFYWDSFSSTGGGVNGVEVIYSANGFGAHVSASEVTNQTAANVSYTFGDWTAALAYMNDTTAGASNNTVLATLGGKIGNFGVGVKAARVKNRTAGTSSNNGTVYGSFEVVSGTTVTAYYTSVDNGAASDNYGIGVVHSLGGATLKAGFAKSVGGTNRADLGASFKF